ncbi:MAG: hypothetical protein V7K35_15235 [Nostoc sp.]|uniref:hypothetical protein n=1 Tax=Nostoc sp. TaxID=1180 RepID=UPI002FF61C35
MRHAATPESGCYSIITYLLMLLANGKLFYNQNGVATALGSGSQFTTNRVIAFALLNTASTGDYFV